MTPIMLGIGLLVFVSTCALDFAHTRYVIAVHDGHRHKAAKWSVIQWMAATIGFIAAIKVSLYLLPFEAAGLYVGTLLGMPVKKEPEIPLAVAVCYTPPIEPRRSRASYSQVE